MSQLARKEPVPLKDIKVAWDGDKLDRKKVAEYLTPVIDSINQPFVISLNSPYGTGKTFFIQHWRKQLKDDGYNTVYFNAWETDYAPDPFAALISIIRKQLPNEHLADFMDAVDAMTMYSLKGAIKQGMPLLLASQGVPAELTKVAGGTIKKAKGAIQDAKVREQGQHYMDIVREFEETEKAMETFRMALKKSIKSMSKKQPDAGKQKLIIFIDDLDRCRPNYALEVLECIKHLFSVEGIVFIISVDGEQLQSTVASAYGLKDTGEGYLRKFIDWQLNLPEPSALQYAAYLYNSFALDETNLSTGAIDYDAGGKTLISTFGAFAQAFGLTLREQAQCFTEINLCMRSLEGTRIPFSFLSAIIPVLKLRYKNEFEECIYGRTDPVKILILIENVPDFVEIYDKGPGSWAHCSSVLHAYLLNNGYRKELHEELSNLSEAEDERIEYLSKVIAIHKQIRHGAYQEHSLAYNVYQRFEFAASLSHATF